MQTRRYFIGNVATGVAGGIATGRVLKASDRIRLGVIGFGERGSQLAREAAACSGTEVVAAADVYSRRQEAKTLFPGASVYADYRKLLEDSSLDAVIIATPQHLHAEHFIAAISAGRHVYQEKAMAFTVEHAKWMRTAYNKAGKRVVQVGHQALSSGHVFDAANYLNSGAMGRVTAIHANMFRNTPDGKPQWVRPVYPDMTPGNVAWEAFQGNSPRRDFDPARFANWRLFFDYSGGNIHENMSQQLAFWYKVMDLSIPLAATMTGGIYRWKDGREVPDTMAVTLEHLTPQNEELMLTWNSGFSNNHLGTNEDVLGTSGTIARGQQIRYVPQKVNRPDGAEILGRTPTAPRAHMQNFLDAIRGTAELSCPFEIGYRVSVACHMAVESYLQGRTVRWDSQTEEFI